MKISATLIVITVGGLVFSFGWLQAEIPEAEMKGLESFFQSLLQNGPLAYTLFGDKPVSMACYWDPICCIGSSLERSLALNRGWELWSCYQSRFPSETFCLKRLRSDWGNGLAAYEIWLINKRATLQVIRENWDLFQHQWSGESTPTTALDEICDPTKEIEWRDESVLGLLLGFGRNNALMFDRWSKLLDHFEAIHTPPFFKGSEWELLDGEERSFLSLKRPKNPTKILPSADLAEELRQIQRKRRRFELPGSAYLLTPIRAPEFIDHSEDIDLVSRYSRMRIAIHEAYSQGSFLTNTLRQWMDPQ